MSQGHLVFSTLMLTLRCGIRMTLRGLLRFTCRIRRGRAAHSHIGWKGGLGSEYGEVARDTVNHGRALRFPHRLCNAAASIAFLTNKVSCLELDCNEFKGIIFGESINIADPSRLLGAMCSLRVVADSTPVGNRYQYCECCNRDRTARNFHALNLTRKHS